MQAVKALPGLHAAKLLPEFLLAIALPLVDLQPSSVTCQDSRSAFGFMLMRQL